jgi:hypothetical protein
MESLRQAILLRRGIPDVSLPVSRSLPRVFRNLGRGVF